MCQGIFFVVRGVDGYEYRQVIVESVAGDRGSRGDVARLICMPIFVQTVETATRTWMINITLFVSLLLLSEHRINETGCMVTDL